MNGLRDDLATTGSAVVAEGAGLRVTPPSVAALGRAVAVLRAHRLPVRVRGNGDAPVEPPANGALLELVALDRVASMDSATGIARVEAGCSVAALETAARRAGATLSHHHGIGLQKQVFLPREHGEGMRQLRALKQAFDPNGILNPGKLLL